MTGQMSCSVYEGRQAVITTMKLWLWLPSLLVWMEDKARQMKGLGWKAIDGVRRLGSRLTGRFGHSTPAAQFPDTNDGTCNLSTNRRDDLHDTIHRIQEQPRLCRDPGTTLYGPEQRAPMHSSLRIQSGLYKAIAEYEEKGGRYERGIYWKGEVWSQKKDCQCWKYSHVTIRDCVLSAISQAARALTQEPRWAMS